MSESGQITDPIFGRAAVPYIRKGRADYYIEPTTELIFQRTLPNVAEMESYVRDQYKSGVYNAYSRARPLKYETGRRRLEKTQAYGLAGNRYLDVGCATGVFMEAAQDAGLDVAGIEISEEARRMAAPEIRKRIVIADVNQYVRESGLQSDLLTAYDILEHVQDPRAFLTDLFGALAPKGVLAIATPTTDHFLRKLMGKSWPMLQPMQHTFLFSKAGLGELIKEVGFTDIVITSAEKVLTLEYLFEQVAEPSPALGRGLMALGRLLPKAVRLRPIGLNISEMFALARRPEAM